MKKLLESLDECGMNEMPPMTPPVDRGQPVSMNVSLNASGKEHVEDLISMMKNAGLGNAKEVGPSDMPAMPMRLDIERLRDVVDGPKMELPAPKDEEIETEEYANEPDEDYRDEKYMTKDIAGGLNREKARGAQRVKDPAIGEEEETLEQKILNALKSEYAAMKEFDDEEDSTEGGNRRIQSNGNTTNFNIDKSKPKSKWKYLGKNYTFYADEDEIEMFLKGDYSKGWERQDDGAKTHALGDEPAGDPDSAMFKGATTFPLKKKSKGKMKPLMPEPGEPGYPE